MTCNISHLNLHEILDKGLNGDLESMSVEDWIFLEYLINKSGETQYRRGNHNGYKKGYRKGQGDSYE